MILSSFFSDSSKAFRNVNFFMAQFYFVVLIGLCVSISDLENFQEKVRTKIAIENTHFKLYCLKKNQVSSTFYLLGRS